MTEAKTNGLDAESRRERAMALTVVGWLLWGFALLFLFFRPAEARLGGSAMLSGVLALGAVGLVLQLAGWQIRRRAR